MAIAKQKLLKILILGNGNVGKTSMRYRYFGAGFKAQYLMTVGSDFGIKRLEYDNKTYALQIWDLAGNPSFAEVRKNYYRGAHGAIFVFDLTNKDSLIDLFDWFAEVETNIGRMVPLIVCGNKSDLIGENREAISNLDYYLDRLRSAYEYDFTYIETSAKIGDNIDEAFKCMIRDIISKE